ncbi:Mur ligase middle domain protein [Methanococcus vannielii SB]|uniref:Mur ligase middle domain protein n=1 Tax=Methanococcus vannielii (strain ATCC 35089 / DSM 1224 / JCM 13029 / OCM 148 / SB) TaxID=406327 RepID=A6URF3_METVS|nr:coenzyme F430 synthase [Methanococcus vannielii]ABR55075.1 Mur ligase middle domain protein [Methanococcus vannielii SB]
MEVLLIDVNHGALDLSREYLEFSKVSVWDIYGKLEKDQKFKEKNIEVISKIKIIPKNTIPVFSEYSSVIAPVHTPIDFKFKTFHEAVSEIITKKYPEFYEKMITVTGVKGKTTTTELLTHILSSKYRVYLHNSNKGSITPVTVLNKLKDLEKNKNIENYDFLIFEISLGVVSSKYSVLTNIIENYDIAGGRKTASVKIDSLKNSEIVLINRETFDNYNCLKQVNLKNLKIIENDIKIISKYPLRYTYNEQTYEFSDFVLGFHFIENANFAVEICREFMEFNDIKSAVKTFQISNRMEVLKTGNFVTVKNMNPGLDLKAIKYAIDDFLKVFETGILVIGGDFGCTCEEIDLIKLRELIMSYDAKKLNVLLSGDIGYELKKYLDSTIIDINKKVFNDNSLIIYRSKID